ERGVAVGVVGRAREAPLVGGEDAPHRERAAEAVAGAPLDEGEVLEGGEEARRDAERALEGLTRAAHVARGAARDAEVVPRDVAALVELDGAAVRGDRGGEVAAARLDAAEVRVGERRVGLELDRAAERLRRLLDLARAEERVAEMEVSARVGGVDLDGAAEVRDGGREAPRSAGDALEVARGPGRVAEVPVAVRAVVEHLDEHLAAREVAEV